MSEDKNIRNLFKEYFSKENDHKWHSSMPLIPHDDPTMLFTTAGMVQFKKQLLGDAGPLKRAASIQKCLRTSDIDEVGKTARHLTFFEMYGNFSFGDYFKKEAIAFAWDFLVNKLSMDPSKFYATVYKDDDEAFELWKEYLPEDRIVRLGDEDNFWQMGETGPCGPCSEILLDQGPEKGCKNPDCFVGCECDRYLEVWNLVFTQFDRQSDGSLHDLPKKNIDTGMGLERLNQVLGSLDNVYETPTIAPILEAVKKISISPSDESLRIVSDHIRSATFMIADGVSPSNEGRGYVLRRLIRRAAREGRQMGWKSPKLWKLTSKVVELMGEYYPELVDRATHISSVCKIEEENFLHTLDTSLKILEDYIKDMREGEELSPDKAFKLYDTHGLPIDITESILKERSLKVDKNAFNKLMAERANSSKWKDKKEIVSYWEEIKELKDTDFHGYKSYEVKTKVKLVSKDQNMIVLEETPFYAESGGQVGDKGFINSPKSQFKVENTVKEDGVILHKGNFVKGNFEVGEEIYAKVDIINRKDIERNHTATHMLQSALRKIIGPHVQQNGSLVQSHRLRFDFTHPEALSTEDIFNIEREVNLAVMSNLPINTEELSLEEAKSRGALAFFGDKYGEQVRVVSVTNKEDSISMEFCGGTHLQNTGEIGFFKIISETGIAAGVRRIEAVTGRKAIEYIQQQEKTNLKISSILKTPVDMITLRIEKLLSELKEEKLSLQNLKNKLAEGINDSKLQKFTGTDMDLVVSGFEGSDISTMRNWLDKQVRSPRDAAVAYSCDAGKVSLIIKIAKELTDNYDAGQVMKSAAAEISGSGGGRKNMAQGGGTDCDSIDKAIDIICNYFKCARSSAG